MSSANHVCARSRQRPHEASAVRRVLSCAARTGTIATHSLAPQDTAACRSIRRTAVHRTAPHTHDNACAHGQATPLHLCNHTHGCTGEPLPRHAASAAGIWRWRALPRAGIAWRATAAARWSRLPAHSSGVFGCSITAGVIRVLLGKAVYTHDGRGAGGAHGGTPKRGVAGAPPRRRRASRGMRCLAMRACGCVRACVCVCVCARARARV